MTELELQQKLLSGEKVYCLLSINSCNYTTVYTSYFCSGGWVEGFLPVEQSPFEFPVYYTEPRCANSWHGRTYYRTAIPVDERTRQRL